MIEPSHQERVELPETSATYMTDLEQRIDELEAQLEEAKAENGRLLKGSAADIQIAYKEGFKQGQYELEYPEADRRAAEQAFAASFSQMRCNALLEDGDDG